MNRDRSLILTSSLQVYNDLGQFLNLQDLVIILSFLLFGEDEFDFFASGIVSAGPTRAILLDYDGLARTL